MCSNDLQSISSGHAAGSRSKYTVVQLSERLRNFFFELKLKFEEAEGKFSLSLFGVRR